MVVSMQPEQRNYDGFERRMIQTATSYATTRRRAKTGTLEGPRKIAEAFETVRRRSCHIPSEEFCVRSISTIAPWRRSKSPRIARQNDGSVRLFHVVPMIVSPTGMPVYIDIYKGQEEPYGKSSARSPRSDCMESSTNC